MLVAQRASFIGNNVDKCGFQCVSVPRRIVRPSPDHFLFFFLKISKHPLHVQLGALKKIL